MKRILILLAIVITLPALAQKKKAPKATVGRADTLFLNGSSKEAIAAYEAAFKDPNAAKDGRAWFRLGSSYLTANDYNHAIEALERSAGLKFRTPQLRLAMARAYSSLNNPSKALENLDSALATGFANYKLVDSDPLLESVRKDSRYNAMREKFLTAAYPCRDLPESRQFDFWLGEWNVHPTANMSAAAGYNKITRAAQGCLIVENWTSSGPHEGMSLNYFNPITRKWTQNWAGSGQDVQEFTDGEFKDGMMRFKYVGRNPDGTTYPGRLTFTPFDGKVRQHAERTADEGKTWQTVYDLTYVRKDAGVTP